MATSASVERLVVRAPNWIGDALLALGSVRDLRRNFPRARLDVLARGWVAELYGAVSEVDGVLASQGAWADATLLRGRYDVALLLPNSLGAALAPWRAGVPERWGYATAGRGPLLTRAARVPAEVRGHSQVYYYRAMLAGVGLHVSADPELALRCPASWQAQADALLDVPALGGAPWVGINPGAFFGGAKRWLPARFAAVGDAAARFGARVVLLGGPAERPLALAIAAQMRTPALVLSGRTTLAGLAAVLARLCVLVTNDSGPMHLAAALGVPVLALFGPTDWRETAPWGAGHHVLRAEWPCAPCKLRECPIDHGCMRALRTEQVVEALRAQLQEVA